VNRIARIGSFATLIVATCAVPAFAQGPAGGDTTILNSSSVGVGLAVIGAAFGISKLASSAYESMARQPEVAGTVNTAMIIAAALIEGFTFYALFILSSKTP
jgi:F-type H+-transporting ATPase subunit c